MSRAPLCLFAAAFLAGIAAGDGRMPLPWLAAASALAPALRPLPLVVRANAVAALALGMLDALALGHPAEVPAGAHPATLHGVVVEREATAGDGTALVVRLDGGPQVEAFLYDVEAPPAIGERLDLHGTLEPLDEPRNPGEPSSRELGAERGIAGRIAQPRVLATYAVDERDPSLWIARARDWASRAVHAALPEPEATILAGAMWGERGALPPDLRAEFQDTGTVHVLVTAGLHLGVVAWLALGLLRAAGCGRISSSLATIAIVWLYACFSGAHLPSMRAATMLSFGLLARATGRDAFSWNALAAAAVVVAALRPQSLLSLSFALSFSCVAAIFLFAKPFVSLFESAGVPGFASEALALTFATQLGTWPLTAAGFLVFAPYAPLANACVVPVVGIAMLAGFLELACSPVPILAGALANVETSLVGWIVAVVRFVAALPGAHVIATPPPAWTIVCYDVALAGCAALTARGRRYAAAALFTVAVVLCIAPPRAQTRDLIVTAIDVGQADALLIQTPQGRAYLVDAGGRLERGPQQDGASVAEAVGERVVVPFLIRRGIHHLDGILLSHPHGDHAGGMAPALRTLGADWFADSGQPYPGHAYHDALDVARERSVPLLEPRAGDVWQLPDGVTFRFYAPSEPYFAGTRNDINDNSLVFRLEYERFTMLFTGDAGSASEDRLLASGVDLRARVLKVGHHGSAYGSQPRFIAAVRPEVALISVGRHNLFGHPAAETLDTLAHSGARIYRTDEDGAITLESDGDSLSVMPMLSVTPARYRAACRFAKADAFARFPQIAISHHRRRPVRESS